MIAMPAEIAQAIIFLLSPQAGGIDASRMPAVASPQ